MEGVAGVEEAWIIAKKVELWQNMSEVQPRRLAKSLRRRSTVYLQEINWKEN